MKFTLTARQASALKCAEMFMSRVGFIPTACRAGSAAGGIIVLDFGKTAIPGYRFRIDKKGRSADFEMLRSAGVTALQKLPDGYEMWRMVLLKDGATND